MSAFAEFAVFNPYIFVVVVGFMCALCPCTRYLLVLVLWQVGNDYYLAIDMRLQCYTGEWTGYAVYGLLIVVVYVIGFPVGIFWLLFKRRHALFGPGSEDNMRKFGFLYDAYGPSAWFWETEELIRKLLLTAVAVLLDDTNPFQVCASVRVFV